MVDKLGEKTKLKRMTELDARLLGSLEFIAGTEFVASENFIENTMQISLEDVPNHLKNYVEGGGY